MANESKDKYAVLQVLGCLMQRPILILDAEHPLTEADFPERFHKIVFGAIEYLAKNGAQSINFASVDNFLERYPQQYKVFTDNRGAEYCENAVAMSDPDNFDVYYTTVRKHSLLSQMAKHGFNTSFVYNPDIVNPKEFTEMQQRFDNYSVQELLDVYQGELASLQVQYAVSDGTVGCQAGLGMRAQKEQYKQSPDMGMPLNSKYLTTITRGRRLKKVYLRTAPTGTGKSRIAAGDACRIAIPVIWDSQRQAWVNTGCHEPTLYITTELEIEEIQSMIVAYVADVPEEQYISGKYTPEEEQRIDRAIEIIEQAPLYVEHVPNFDIDDLERIIKEYKLRRGVGYVFFDYIFTSIKMLTEIATKTRGVKMREDNALIMFIDRMKTLANLLNIHIDTSTQANGDWKNNDMVDQSVIRGAKGMADKVDVGLVALPPSAKDREGIAHILQKGFTKEPNLVYHVYKVRRGRLNHVRLWLYFDYATCRTEDLFVTDNEYRILDVDATNIEVVLDKTEEEKPDFFF